MTATAETALQRWGVFHRPGPRRPWALVAHAATEPEARTLMFSMMGRGRSGDWRAGPLDDPNHDPRQQESS